MDSKRKLPKSSGGPTLICAVVTVVALALAPAMSAVTLADAVTHVKIRTLLLEKLGTDALGIDIDVNGGNVALTGSVEKKPTGDLAKEVALSVRGVNHVDENIRLEGAPGSSMKNAARHAESEVKDAILEAKVKGRLLDQIGENAMKIEVEASNGVVSLRGTVPTDDIRDTAITAARHTHEVRRVVDLLHVA
jgi:hyperosmotically inducible protein